MILAVGGTKGGSGKTLLATNLTVIRAQSGQDVLLIDADDQASATLFTRQREQRTDGKPLYTAIQSFEADVIAQVRSLAAKYDDIIIDVGGRDTASQRAALAVAETLLMPFAPTSVDLWTDDNVITLLKDARPFNPHMRVYAFINKAFFSGSDNADAAAILQEHPEYWQYLDMPIGHRKAFSSAFGKGNAITEHTPKDAKAIHEMMALYLHIFNAENTQQLRNIGA